MLGRSADVGFTVGAHDPSRPLVIDPAIVFSTYLGGTKSLITAVASDAAGNAYTAGSQAGRGIASSQGSCGPSGSSQTSCGGYDAYIVAVDPTGKLLYGTSRSSRSRSRVRFGRPVRPSCSAWYSTASV